MAKTHQPVDIGRGVAKNSLAAALQIKDSEGFPSFKIRFPREWFQNINWGTLVEINGEPYYAAQIEYEENYLTIEFKFYVTASINTTTP